MAYGHQSDTSHDNKIKEQDDKIESDKIAETFTLSEANASLVDFGIC